MRTILPFTLFFLFSMVLDAQVYVQQRAGGANNGTSWFDAYTDLQAALDNAPPGSEIWIGAGVYKPEIVNQPADSNYFIVDTSLTLIGGFLGFESSIDQRDIANNKVILSGDINGDDIDGDFQSNRADNVIHVLFLTSPGIRLDGLYIRNGHTRAGSLPAEGRHAWRGGGIHTIYAATIKNCTFEQNLGHQGGGLYCTRIANELILDNCSFVNNSATSFGGGIAFGNGSIQVLNSTFRLNSSLSLAGGLSIFQNSDLLADVGLKSSMITVENCIFEENFGPAGGGMGLQNLFPNSSLVIKGCHFELNQSDAGGGLRVFSRSTEPVNEFTLGLDIDSCTFYENLAVTGGGGVWIQNNQGISNVKITHCAFDRNQGLNRNRSFGGGLLMYTPNGSGNLIYEIEDCSFIGNEARIGGGFYDESNSTPATKGQISKIKFENNLAYFFAGGIAKFGGSLKISRSDFTSNIAGNFGGGLYSLFADTLHINTSVFSENFATEYGAAVMSDQDSVFHLENSILDNNAGAFALWLAGNAIVRNVSIVDNDKGIQLDDYQDNPRLIIQNTVLNNQDDNFSLLGVSEVMSLGGNVSSDATLEPYINGYGEFKDYHTTDPGLNELFQPANNSSVCIDKGNPEGIDLSGTDLAGNPRVQGGQVDVGAFESPLVSSLKRYSQYEKLGIQLISNPVQEQLAFKVDQPINSSVGIEILNNAGQLVRSKILPSLLQGEIHEWNIGELSSGMYYLRLNSDNDYGIMKFQKH